MSHATAQPSRPDAAQPTSSDAAQLAEEVHVKWSLEAGNGNSNLAAGCASPAPARTTPYVRSLGNLDGLESECEDEDEEQEVWSNISNPCLELEPSTGKQRQHLDMIKEGILEWWGSASPNSEDMTVMGGGFHESGFRESWCGAAPMLPTSPQTRLLQRGLFGAMRRKASQRRQRFEWDGFDLDLTYVTTRVIAMGFPAQGPKIAWQNPHSEVSRFLCSRHEGHFRIWNLCGEDSHSDNGFPGHTVRYPCADHCPPSLMMMHAFCRDVEAWLRADKEHVAVIHCKAGKGRTGSMICALLLYSRALSSAYEALRFYAAVRGGKRSGVTVPSQIRWIAMFDHWLRRRAIGLSGDPMGASPMLYRLRSVSWGPLVDLKEADPSTFVIEVGLTTRDQVARAGLPTGVVHWYEEVTATASGGNVIEVPLPDCGPIWVESDGLLVIIARRWQRGPSMRRMFSGHTTLNVCTLRFWAWWHHAFLQKRAAPSGNGYELLLDLPASYVDGMQRGGPAKEIAATDFRLKAVFEEISPVDTTARLTDKTTSNTESLETLSFAARTNTTSSGAGMIDGDQTMSLRWHSDASQESVPEGGIALLDRSRSMSSVRRQVMI